MGTGWSPTLLDSDVHCADVYFLPLIVSMLQIQIQLQKVQSLFIGVECLMISPSSYQISHVLHKGVVHILLKQYFAIFTPSSLRNQA
jgi:hypothetical protein